MMLFIKSIHTEYSFWLIFLCLGISAFFTYFIYRNDHITDEIKPWLLWIIKVLRFVFIFMICFLLLKPLVKTLTKNIQQPLVIFAQDNSASIIANSDSLFYRNEYPEKVQKLIKSIKNAEVKSYSFDNKLYNNLEFDFSGQSTNLSYFFNEIKSLFFNQHVGALIVATDGIYNEGVNPYFQENGLEFPVYFIALGDTSIPNDLFIKKVLHNNITFYKNKFPVKIEIGATNLNNKNATLSILHKNKEIVTKAVQINSDDFFTTFELELLANEKGIQEYDVVLSVLDGEKNSINNAQKIIIDVIDTKTKILLLYNSPHPDITAIRSTLVKNESFSFTSHAIKDFSGKLQEYDLIIFHQLPSANYSLNSQIRQINNAKIPALFILGSQTSIQSFNHVQSELKINSVRSNAELSQVAFNKDFISFNVDEASRIVLEEFPPLNTVFGTYTVSNQGNILFFQKNKNIQTSAPLIYFSEMNEHKMGYITGEGLWRWRLYNYKVMENQEIFDHLINKSIQYLTLNVKKDRLNIDIDKTYAQNQVIPVNAELYNKNFELVNDPELKFQINSSKALKYEYVFNKSIKAYELKIAGLPAGKYNYKADVKLGDEFLSKTGEFLVYENSIELMQTKADFNLLYQLARKNGGEVILVENLEKLPEILNTKSNFKPIISYHKKLNDFINMKALLILLLAFVSTEWFIRKYFGGY